MDEIGNHTSKWDEVFSCWAKVSVKSSAEQVNTGVTREIQSVSFLVRQSSYLLSLNATTHRILFRGQTFDIVSVKPDYEKMDYLAIEGEVRRQVLPVTSIDDMASEIMKGLQEYADLADTAMKKAVRKSATQVKNEISANAPADTGKYAKSWATKKTGENSHSLEMTVHSKNRYQLAHLLEKGHAKRGGGRVSGKPHIAPAEENGVQLLEHLIEEALS